MEKMKNERQRRSRKLAFGGDIALFLHCNVLASRKYERQLLNGNLLRKTQVLSLLMKKLDGNNFYNLKLRLQRKSSRNRRVVSGLFLAHGAANLHMCA